MYNIAFHKHIPVCAVYAAVIFLIQLIFIFPLFLGMVMHANEFKTKEKQKLTEIKKINCNIYNKLVCHINTVCMTSHVVIKVVKS